VKPEDLTEVLRSYCALLPTETTVLERALRDLERGYDLTDRSTARGHTTVNAVLVSPVNQALVVYHTATQRWLTPGGHLEAEDETLEAAALRELEEEVGVVATDLMLLPPVPFDITIHENPPCHTGDGRVGYHLDVKFLFRTSSVDLPISSNAAEVGGSEWRPALRLAPRLGAKLADRLKYPDCHPDRLL